jgi:hypothetical protein
MVSELKQKAQEERVSQGWLLTNFSDSGFLLQPLLDSPPIGGIKMFILLAAFLLCEVLSHV